MALQPYQDAGQALALYQAAQISPEEQERRRQEAEELDKKLRYIVEDVPDRMYHVMGSNAGAGSSEFHTYRNSRRREQERLKRVDAMTEHEEKEAERQERLAQLEHADEERTAKRRAKRQKRKEKQRGKKLKREDGTAGTVQEGEGGGAKYAAAAAVEKEGSSDEEEDGAPVVQPQSKRKT